jgi:hypothetical protein
VLRRLARTQPNLPLDLAHIAEEIPDLGNSEYPLPLAGVEAWADFGEIMEA